MCYYKLVLRYYPTAKTLIGLCFNFPKRWWMQFSTVSVCYKCDWNFMLKSVTAEISYFIIIFSPGVGGEPNIIFKYAVNLTFCLSYLANYWQNTFVFGYVQTNFNRERNVQYSWCLISNLVAPYSISQKIVVKCPQINTWLFSKYNYQIIVPDWGLT